MDSEQDAPDSRQALMKKTHKYTKYTKYTKYKIHIIKTP